MNLRPYQHAALKAIREKYQAGVLRQAITMPTGVGKTVVFSALPALLNLNKRFLVLVHREELADQAADKLRRWNPTLSVGIEMADRQAGDAQIVVASVPTLRKGSPRLLALRPEEFGAICTDECHHSVADSYTAVYEHFGLPSPQNKILHLGVTATLNRADGTGLDKVFDEVVYSMGILDAIKAGWLVDIRGYKVFTDQSIDNVHVRCGDFAQDELANAVNNVPRNEVIVKHWKEKAVGRPTIVFCVDVAHSRAVAETFQQHGIKAKSVWGGDPERAVKLNQLRNGEIEVLTNCQLTIEGYDDWHISAVVLARPTKSQLLFVQQCGRGLRLPDGIDNLVEARAVNVTLVKEDCVVLDVVDSTSRHSLVTLPQLFGMPVNMDLAGRKITAAVDHFNKVQEEHPSADLSKAPDLTKLNSYAVSVDVFSMRWADEVLNSGAKLQWHQTGDGHYTLYHPKGRLDIQEDLLQKWSVKGHIETYNTDLQGLPDLCDAFRVAEKFVREYAPETMTLVRREARWHSDPASEAQVRLLRKFRVPIPEGITKGQAQIALNRYLKPRG